LLFFLILSKIRLLPTQISAQRSYVNI